MFFTPLFCPVKFVKSSEQCFGKKSRRRRKNFEEVPFFKKLTFLGKFNGFQRFFSGFHLAITYELTSNGEESRKCRILVNEVSKNLQTPVNVIYGCPLMRIMWHYHGLKSKSRGQFLMGNRLLKISIWNYLEFILWMHIGQFSLNLTKFPVPLPYYHVSVISV